MKREQKTKVRQALIKDMYVNADTGELMSSELENVSVTLNKSTNQFVINSNDYVVFDTEAMLYLAKEVNSQDIGRLVKMACMAKTECAILFQENNAPHTPETLSVSLDLSINKFYILIRKLVKKNILAYAVCAPTGYVQKIYMLNPYIARKRKNLSCELKTFFRDITKQ